MTTGSGGTMATGGMGATGPVAPACAQLPGCDDFENYTSGQRPAGEWTGFEVDGGSLAVDGTRGFGASRKSIKISVNAGDGGRKARMQHKGTGLLPADVVFMRMMFWMEGATPRGEGHWNWIWGDGDLSLKSGGLMNNASIATGGFLGSDNTFLLYTGAKQASFVDCFSPSSTKIPVGRWACLEFELNSTTNSVRSWIDGKLDLAASVEQGIPISGMCVAGHNPPGLWLVPRPQRVFFGWTMFHSVGAPATAWLDDIAMATTRIGCPATP